MKATSHTIQHQYQPTENSCSPTALSILLGHYGAIMTPQQIEAVVPQIKDANGNDAGTITQNLAAWSTTQGFHVSMYTFDCQIIDQSWITMTADEVKARLTEGLDGATVKSIGKEWSRAYRQSYIDYLNTDNSLIIKPAVTSLLLYTLLENGPLLSNICLNTLYGKGKSLKGDEVDDIHGKAWNHSIVIYGNDTDGHYLVADPIVQPGLHTIDPERMIAAISAAQIECDNLLFQITPLDEPQQ